MFIVRGENIYPSAIEDVLRATEGFGEEFRILITRERTMDELTVQAEYSLQFQKEARENPQVLERLRETLETRLRVRLGVRTRVELIEPGKLDRTQFKARRVIDKR
jgi:phenylacetate-CoA ligase